VTEKPLTTDPRFHELEPTIDPAWFTPDGWADEATPEKSPAAKPDPQKPPRKSTPQD
jgi:hypothetical protein